MTTEAQKGANHANAQKSTGPRTESGKQRSSRNAQRHGLNTDPPHEEVNCWVKCIKGSLPTDPDASTVADSDTAVLALAEAEARLARTRDAEEDFLRDLEADRNLAPHLRHAEEILTVIRHSIPGVHPDLERQLLARHGKVPYEAKLTLKESWTDPYTHFVRLGRYRRAAEVARHRALKTWISALSRANSKTNPNAI